MPHANNPYASADPCEHCGSRQSNQFVTCESCRKSGCDLCITIKGCCDYMNIVERTAYATEPHGETYCETWSECSNCGERADEETIRHICGDCLESEGRVAPKVQYHQTERDDCEVTF